MVTGATAIITCTCGISASGLDATAHCCKGFNVVNAGGTTVVITGDYDSEFDGGCTVDSGIAITRLGEGMAGCCNGENANVGGQCKQ